MSCDCYKIGGPWVTYDPSCPAHGDEAKRERREQEDRETKLEADKLALTQALQDQAQTIKAMNENIGKMVDLITNLDFRLKTLERKVAQSTTRFK